MSSVLRISGELLDGFPNEGEAERYLSEYFESASQKDEPFGAQQRQQQQQGFQQLAQQQQQQQQRPLVGNKEGPKERKLESPTLTPEERDYSRALGEVHNIWQLRDFNI